MAIRGAVNVRLLKASTSHKRFTYTPTVTAAGELLESHILFSNLQNVPRNVHAGTFVEVNKTGMWDQGRTKTYHFIY